MPFTQLVQMYHYKLRALDQWTVAPAAPIAPVAEAAFAALLAQSHQTQW